MNQFPSQLPTGDILEVLPSIFVVAGQMLVGDGAEAMSFSRNMTIVRDRDVLTLINTVRLGDEGLATLDALGTVRNVVRLGAMHGRDDAFYLDRYAAAFWAMPEMDLKRGEKITDPLIEGEPGPCLQSSVFAYETTSKPEAILQIQRHGGVLVACDSLQNFVGPDRFFNPIATEKMRAHGFLRPANVGPGWRRVTEPEPNDFSRLKQLEFKHVLSAHGEPCLDTALDQFSDTFAELFSV